MSDFFEIDFLDVEADKSGDAIAARYGLNGLTWIHVVDGGFQDTGTSLANHIRTYYGNPAAIDHVVATHPDGDHLGGLRVILEEFGIAALWMLRPWAYAAEILHRFKPPLSLAQLQKVLREAYPNVAALEEIALERGISIYEPFQGQAIGAFRVMAPTKARYLDAIVNSEKTPDAIGADPMARLAKLLYGTVAKAAHYVKAGWSAETFPPDETSAENEMSVVQYAHLCGQRILLTADAGRAALTEAANYAPFAGLLLPGLDRFQVPHHGSRRNVSSALLDRWLGPKLPAQLPEGQQKFTAIVSSAKKDEDHPRKAVVRAMIHRGAKVITTEGRSIASGMNAPDRGWVGVPSEPYPQEQEE